MKNNNSTLGRKPGNDMIENAGFHKPVRGVSQKGDGESFAFNGQMGDGVNRAGNRFAGNQSGLAMKENYGMAAAARRGNASDSSRERREQTGPSVTKDRDQMTIATAGQGHNIGDHKKVTGFPNPDAINVGSK